MRIEDSQFPFWDFFCCNVGCASSSTALIGVGPLNSLFGISFVVTGSYISATDSRFLPRLSIPFLGFLLL